MARMTGGQALARSLRRYAVDTVFGLPGVQLDHLFNAFYDEGNALRVVQTRHEQGAAYMALGYAQSTGRVGVYAVVPGPGLLNTTAALATAYGCNARVLAVSGQVVSDAIGRGYGMLHELPDQLGLIRGLTKWAQRIEHPAQVPEAVQEAFSQLHVGVARPVELEMAMDLLGLEAEVELVEPLIRGRSPAPDPDLVKAAAKLLGNSERPLIVCGGGAVDASAQLLEVAQMLEAPVITHRRGRGVLSDRHYLAQNLPSGHKLWAKADVVLAVGTRLQQQALTWGVDDALKVVRIDIDPSQMHRFGKPTVGIVADSVLALDALANAVAKTNRKRPSREDELTALKSATAHELEKKLGPQVAFLKALRRALPDEGLFVEELTQVGYVARTMFPVYRPRTYLSSGYQGTLGAGFPTALGAKIANPGVPVLSINGDGGFMFNVQELATAVMHGIDVVTVVFNDGAYGNVKRIQEDFFAGRVIASDLRNPDFVRLAESFGANGYRAASPSELGLAVGRAIDRGGVSVIEVPVGKMPDPWGVSQPLKRARTRA